MAPSAPARLSATAVSSSQVNLSWAAATDNVGVTGYRVERCTGHWLHELRADRDADAARRSTTRGCTAGDDVSVSGAGGGRGGEPERIFGDRDGDDPSAWDTTPPSAPTSLTGTAVSTSQMNLSWAAATDNVGVTGYRVERCTGASCNDFAQIGTPTRRLQRHGLAADTYYGIRCGRSTRRGTWAPTGDRDGDDACAPDTSAPSAPTSLRDGGGDDAGESGWTASTDNVGVTGYRVERCQGAGCTNFAQVGTRRDELRRHGAAAEHHLSVSGAGGRCCRQPRLLLGDREATTPAVAGYFAAVAPATWPRRR